jgi:hypothetical protein
VIFIEQNLGPHVAGILVHRLNVELPGDAVQLALRAQLRELRLVVRVVDGPKPQPAG